MVPPAVGNSRAGHEFPVDLLEMRVGGDDVWNAGTGVYQMGRVNRVGKFYLSS